jgi:hypothetical protein
MSTTTSNAQGSLLGTGAVLVWNDVSAEGREQFYQWHDKEHIPERLALPGFRRGRRYRCEGHSPEWLTLYEADDIGVVVSPAYMARLNAPTPLTQKTLRYFLNTSRAVCSIAHSVGTSSGGHVLALRLDVSVEGVAAMRAYLEGDAFPRALAITGVLACHLYGADSPASHLDTAESSTRTFDVPAWVVLVEASTAEGAQSARALVDADALQRFGASVRQDAAIYALEICRLPVSESAN